MMERKLIACVAYAIRTATKGGFDSTADVLWTALYDLTREKTCDEPQGTRISLAAALGFRRDVPSVVQDDGSCKVLTETVETWTQTHGKMIPEHECKPLWKV